MGTIKRLASSMLLAAGLVLVFAGLSHALGFSVPAMAASIAVITALLYAGGVWFGGTPAVPLAAGVSSVSVFDRDLHVVAGSAVGTRITQRFPAALRPRIEAHCRAALRGESSGFTCEIDGQSVAFDVSPVATSSGPVMYGVLVAGVGPALPDLAPAAAAVS
jgi:hypothetical protein